MMKIGFSIGLKRILIRWSPAFQANGRKAKWRIRKFLTNGEASAGIFVKGVL